MDVKISSQVRWFDAAEGAVLLNVETSRYYHLNEMGTVLWRAVAENSLKSDAAKAISERYNLSEEKVNADVTVFYKKLMDLGFLSPV